MPPVPAFDRAGRAFPRCCSSAWKPETPPLPWGALFSPPTCDARRRAGKSSPPVERPTVASVEAASRPRGHATPHGRRALFPLGSAWWCEICVAPIRTLFSVAAERRPSSRKGLTAVAMRPLSPTCVRMGAPNSPATGRALSALSQSPLCQSVVAVSTGVRIITGPCRRALCAAVAMPVPAGSASAIVSCDVCAVPVSLAAASGGVSAQSMTRCRIAVCRSTSSPAGSSAGGAEAPPMRKGRAPYSRRPPITNLHRSPLCLPILSCAFASSTTRRGCT